MNKTKSISFVLPMFNEEGNIQEAINTLNLLGKELSPDHEIVIVDDASTDESARIVGNLSKNDERIRFFALPENTKFGGAFAKGFSEAAKDVIVYMDSDMPVSIEDIKEAYFHIDDYDIINGHSKIKKGDSLMRKVMSVVYNFLVQTLFGLNIKDINSGFKIVRTDIVRGKYFVSRSPFVDVEMFLNAKNKKARIYQYPLIFKPRSAGKSYMSRVPIIWATFHDMLKVKVLSLKGKI